MSYSLPQKNRPQRTTWHRVRYVLGQSDSSLLEAVLTVCLLGWSYILLVSFPTLLSTSPSYAPMSQIMPQRAWGVIWLVVAIVTLAGWVWEVRSLRALGALAGTFLWATIAMTFYLTIEVPTGALVYTAFVAGSALVVMRQVRRAR